MTLDELEHRADRRPRYDLVDTSKVIHPNGTVVVSQHVGFIGAAAREVLALYRKETKHVEGH